MRLAITGGTGFIGRHLIRLALERGHSVSALTRRPQAEETGMAWIEGDLGSAPALAQLCEGADAVIHAAGAINAPDRAQFLAANASGTQAMIDAARAAGIKRFVHVSSLAAREPDLSNYGWSKAESEKQVEASDLAWTIVRPPAVYGPGDREMLELFRMANRRIMLLPPGGRLSLIAAEDLTRLLLALATSTLDEGRILEPDDGTASGWSHTDFARMIGRAVGKAGLTIATPAALLGLGSWIDRLLRGGKAKLTADRVRYFCHQDWVVGSTSKPDPTLWQPQVDTAQGLTQTAQAYREAGWL